MTKDDAPVLLSLDDPRTRDASLTGGKASALAALTGAGQPVPPGFVLTTAAFDDGTPSGSLRPEARAQLARALEALGGAVAVRSSGLAEDLAGASFAGQYETVLDVEGEAAVCEAAARCLASAHAPRVGAYRAERGIAFAPMAVLVQKLVRPRAAGVAFTAHPVTGERGLVFLSATRGLGERLVSGEIDGEEWEVRQGAERLRAGREDVLTADDAGAIAALARGVGDGPMDVEWAITGSGAERELHVLQARPMTALPDPVSWESPAAGGYVRNFRLGEWLGAPMTPICATWVIPELEGALHGAFEELGGIPMPQPGHVVVNGWYFYGGMNLRPTLWNILRSIPHAIRAYFSPRRAQLLAGMPPLAHLGFDSETLRWREKLLPVLRDAVTSAEANVAAADPPALLSLVQWILDVTAQQVISIVGVAGYAAKAELAALKLLKKQLPGHDVTVFDLVAGADVTPAAHDVEGLDPFFPTLGERGALPPPPSDEVRARVRERRDAAEERTLAAAKPRARGKIAAAIAEARRAHAVRIEQTGQLTLGWPVLRRALLRLGEHAAAQGVIAETGDVFFLERAELQAVVGGATERVDVEARRRTWERQRRLSPPLLVGELTGLGKQIFPMIAAMLHHEEHDAPDAIVGMPGSPGRVTGPARVVRSVDELDRLQPGEVLVTPVTTPAWTLGFSRARAIVTDTGSVASHASIVAREHGIPAVVGTGDATARLRDGMIVTVDGSRGVVRLGAVP